jgi:hypothetical protein
VSRSSSAAAAYDSVEIADKRLYRDAHLVTAGAAAYHQLTPLEILMEMEESTPARRAETERAALRDEIFAGFAEYLFADGPAPVLLLARIEGLLESFAPDLANQIHGPAPDQWVSEEAVAAVLKKYKKSLSAVASDARGRGGLCAWSRELEREHDLEFVRDTLVALAALLASEGLARRNLVAVAYCLAKILRPVLIAGMSLHDIAILSGDGGGRATPGDRAKRLYSRRLADAGFLACQTHYQKSASATATYAAVQVGNRNRAVRKKLSKKKP